MSTTPIARATSLATAIRAKMPMMALLGDPKQAAKVEGAIRELAAAQIGFVRIGNPTDLPLSLEQLVQQIAGDRSAEPSPDHAERVLRALIARSDMRRQVVVVVEQAETLTPEALEFLHGLPELNHPSLALVQVALVGDATLAPQIADNRTYIIADPSMPAPSPAPNPAPNPAPSPAPAPAALTSPLAIAATAPRVANRGRPRSEKFFLAGLGLLGVVAFLFMINGFSKPDIIPPTPSRALAPAEALTASPPTAAEPPQTDIAPQLASPAASSIEPPAEPLLQPPPALAPASRPALAQATPPTSAPTSTQSPPPASTQSSPSASAAALPLPEPPVPPLAPPPDDAAAARARLYRDFNAFVSSRGVGKRLSQAQRQALFEEYLARHQSAPSLPQTAPPAEVETSRIPGDPHVLLFFAADSDPDREAAEQQADLLRDRVAGLEMHPEADMPTVPTIRYDYPSDRPAADALAQTIWADAGEWQIVDMTATPTRPEPGTIEMWFPRR